LAPVPCKGWATLPQETNQQGQKKTIPVCWGSGGVAFLEVGPFLAVGLGFLFFVFLDVSICPAFSPPSFPPPLVHYQWWAKGGWFQNPCDVSWANPPPKSGTSPPVRPPPQLSPGFFPLSFVGPPRKRLCHFIFFLGLLFL